jgi:hypothetical protein
MISFEKPEESNLTEEPIEEQTEEDESELTETEPTDDFFEENK